MKDSVELPSVSQASQLSQISNRQQLQDNIRPNAVLIPQGQPEINQRWRFLKNKNIIKFALLLCMIGIVAMLINYLFSEKFLKSRVPTSLVTDVFSFQKKPQMISPQQSDFKSFQFFEQMQKISRTLAKEDRQPTSQQLDSFKGINFEQFYDIFKIATTIQLAKNYQQSDSTSVISENDIDNQANFTSYFSDVVDQHRCASCYSFPITATIQFVYQFYMNKTVKLSEQQLIDCVHENPAQNGCQDGNITKGFQYAMNVGLVQQKHYPYASLLGKSFDCKKSVIQNKDIPKFKISDFEILPLKNCSAIQEKLQQNYTIAAMMNAANLGSYQYNKTFSDCPRTGLNHAVTVVGQTNKNEWIIRNSWGKGWGEYGYFKLGRGNTCGICLHAIVPKLYIKDNKVISAEQMKNQTKT